jgi:signal transduction histidine kinase/Flp pilus assembly protein TadD
LGILGNLRFRKLPFYVCVFLLFEVKLLEKILYLHLTYQKLKIMKPAFFIIIFHFLSQAVWAQYRTYIVQIKQRFEKASTLEQKSTIILSVTDSIKNGIAKDHTPIEKQHAYLDLCYFFEKRATNEKLLPEVYTLFTHFYFQQGDGHKHLEYAYKVVDYGKKHDKIPLVYDAYNYISNFYYGSGQHEDALPILLEAEKIIEGNRELEIKKQYPALLNVIAISYSKTKQYEQANKYFEKALRTAQRDRDTAWIGLSYGNMSMVNEAKGDYRKAIEYLKQDIKYSLLGKNPASAVNAWVFMADLYGRLKEYKHGSQALDSAWVLLGKLTKQDIIGGVNVVGLYKKAYKFYKESKQYEKLPLYTDSLLSFFEKDRKNNFYAEAEKIHSKYNVKFKEQELQNLQKQKDAERWILYLVGLVAISVITLAFVLFRNIRKQIKNNALLQEKQEEIEAQNEELNIQKEQLAIQNETLQKINGTKDKLFSIVSHDFRSPLNALKATTYLMSKQDITPTEIQDLTEQAKVQINHTSYFLENLLFWAKSQLKGFHTEIEIFELQELVKENIELTYPQAEQKHIKLEVTIPENIWIIADKNMNRLVLRNLLSNALKYCRQGDTIHLTCEIRQDEVLVCVKDTGLGIQEEQLQTLFTPYTQSTYGTNNEKGAGLGLLLCKDFVERNGGKIWVESEAGKGSAFFFTLPVGKMEREKYPNEAFLVTQLENGGALYQL